MRKICYKGKSISTGKWVQGGVYLLEKIPKAWIFTPEAVAVKPESVCQYTGCIDKNGKEIFENDIVEMRNLCDGSKKQGSIIYIDNKFIIKGFKIIKKPLIFNLLTEDPFIEVVGNIFDNDNYKDVIK